MYDVGLPDEVLKKVYYGNALRVIPGLGRARFLRRGAEDECAWRPGQDWAWGAGRWGCSEMGLPL